MNRRWVIIGLACAWTVMAADVSELTGLAWPPGPAPLPAGQAVTVTGPDGRSVTAWQIVALDGRHPSYNFPWRAALPGVRYHVSLWLRTTSGPTPAVAIQDTEDEEWRPNWRRGLGISVETRGSWERYEGWFTPVEDSIGRWRLVLRGPAVPRSDFLVTGIDIRPELPPLELPPMEDPERLLEAANAACLAARQTAAAADQARILELLERGAE